MNTPTGTSTPEPLDDRPSNHATLKTPAIRPAYYADPHLALYTGDALDVLSELPEDSVHCVVTSPPYWALRDYGTATWIGGTTDCAHSARPASVTPSAAHREGNPRTCQHCGAIHQDRQYGLEATAEDYVDTLRAVFTQLRRVLIDTGTVWLNLGDSYRDAPPKRRTRILPRKNLRGMPWRVAFALQADGWILRNAIVWHKPNAMPESVRDRLSTRYEMLFLFAAQQRYWFDLDAIREPPPTRPDTLRKGIVIKGLDKSGRAGVNSTVQRRRHSAYRKYSTTEPFAGAPPGSAMTPTGRRHTATHPRGSNPGDVWSIPTRPLREAHFAAFPIDIPLRAIAAGCPPGGTVLDPFSGAATTALAARHLDRSYIGIDLNPEFHAIGLRRLGLDPTTIDHLRSAA
jgi:DNA modification methylase